MQEPAEKSIFDYVEVVKEYTGYLWQKKWVLLILSVLFTGITTLYFKLNKKPDEYIASCSFMLYDSDKGISSLNSILGASQSSGTSNKDLIIYLLGSRRIVEDMLLSEAEFNGKNDLIINHYARISGLKTYWESQPVMKDYTFSKNPAPEMVDFQDSIIGNIYGSIASAESFDIDQKSWKMAMSYKHTDGHFAKLIAVEQIKSLCNFYITRKKSKGLETAEFLQRKKDSLQQAIRGRESAFAAWKDSNQKLIKAAGETEEAKFKQDLTLMNSVYSETNRQLETARLALLDESPIVQIIDTPKYPLPKTVSSNIKLLIIAVSILGILLISGILIAQKVLGEFIRKEKEKKLKNELRG